MADCIINDKRLLHVCMLYETLQNRPVFDSYLNFCASLDCYELDYRVFEIWYLRFERGLTDFDYDISEELENKPTLSDMPMDVITRVLGNLDYKTHLVLRKVSKSLRQIVDQRPAPYKRISLSIHGNNAILTLDRREVREESVEAAIQDLKCAIQHPKVQLEVLKIRTSFYTEMETRKKFSEDLKDAFATLPFRRTRDVKTLEMSVKTIDEILAVVPHLTSGFLETINIQLPRIESSYFTPRLTTPRLPMKSVIKLEQWKLAKHLDLDRFSVQFPIENISHFESTKIRFASISMEQLKVLRDALLLRPKFISLDLQWSRKIEFDSISEHLGAGIPHGRSYPGREFYPVPDSDDHLLQVCVYEKMAQMRRIAKADRTWH